MTELAVLPEADARTIVSTMPSLLAESPVWDERRQELLWTDIHGGRVWALSAEGCQRQLAAFDEPAGFIALSCDPDIIAIGLRANIVSVDRRNGAIRTVATLPDQSPASRINDGCAAPDGSLHFGTLDKSGADAAGRFWRLSSSGLAPIGDLACITTNGPAFSPDGRTVYCVDTRGRQVRTAAVRDGMWAVTRQFVRFPEGAGNPDGLAIDSDEGLWVGHWGGGRVTRFNRAGQPCFVVRLPVANVTKCCFGGPDFTTLFITTACSPAAAHPAEGHVFSVEVPFRGTPAQKVGPWLLQN